MPLVPRRPGRQRRVPDEPVQHRRGGPVPLAAVVAAAAGAMVHLPRRCTSRSSCWSPWRPARPTAAIAGRPEGETRRQRGHHHDHAQQHRRGADRLPAARTAETRRCPRTPVPPPARCRSRRGSPGSGPSLETFGLQPPSREVGGFIFVAIVVGVIVSVVMNRTRFGFALRASGSQLDRRGCERHPRRSDEMQAMLLSGALAGLVGMPQVLGEDHAYSINFVAGLGFSGIAVALLGRNRPVGIAVGGAAVRLPRPGRTLAATGRHPPVGRRHHPGSDRPVGRHRQRGRAAHAGARRGAQGRRRHAVGHTAGGSPERRRC